MEYKKSTKLKILLKLQLLIAFLSIINQNIFPATKIRISRFANAKDGYEQIMSAIKNNNKAKLKKLIKQDSLFHAVSALMWVADNGDKKAVQLLIEAGMDVNVVDNDGYTALMWAAQSGRKEIVKFLISKKANVNIVSTRNGSTALIAALSKGHQTSTLSDAHKEIISLLIDAKADVNIANKVGHTALIEATYIGNTEIVKLLIDNGADVNSVGIDGYTALIEAAMKGHKDIVELLLKAGADIDKEDIGKLRAVDHAKLIHPTDTEKIRRDKIEIIKLLNQARVESERAKAVSGKKESKEPDAGDEPKESESSESCSSKDLAFKLKESKELTKLDNAISKDDSKSIGQNNTENKSEDMQSITYESFEQGLEKLRKIPTKFRVAELDKKAGACTFPSTESQKESKWKWRNALLQGIQKKDLSLIKKACSQDIDIKNFVIVIKIVNNLSTYSTIISFVIDEAAGDLEILKLLIDHGADVNMDDTSGVPPLFKAIMRNNMDAVNLLIKSGSDIKIKNNCNVTPLHVAIKVGMQELAYRLIAAGADINAMTTSGETPLSVAASYNHMEIVLSLLENRFELLPIEEDKVSTLLNIKGKSGDLIRNIIFKKVAIIDALLKMRRITEADINWQDSSGMNSIMWAAVRCPKVADKLLTYCKDNGYRANLSLVNCKGQTASSLAVKYKEDIDEVIRIYGLLTSNGLPKKINDLITSYLFGESSSENLLKPDKECLALPSTCTERGDLSTIGLTTAHEATSSKACLPRAEHSALSSQLKSVKSFDEVVGSRAFQIPSSLSLGEKGDEKAIGNAKKESKSKSPDSELYKATVMSNKKKVELLIQNGANVNVYSPIVGYTPLMAASMFGYEDIVQLLIPARADVNAVNYIAGDTALNLAVMSGHRNIVKLLIDAKANVNAGLKDGTTPLMNAARAGNKNIVKLLLIAGADINRINMEKMKAIDFAQLVEGYSETVKKNKAAIFKLLNLESEYTDL